MPQQPGHVLIGLREDFGVVDGDSGAHMDHSYQLAELIKPQLTRFCHRQVISDQAQTLRGGAEALRKQHAAG